MKTNQSIQLSDHFGYRKLLGFTLPTIATMIFTSIYSVVDGVFVSNFVGKTPFAAVNLMMPFLFLIGVVGSMLGTGGSALVAKTLGEGDHPKANRIFSMLILACFASGVIFGSLGIVFLERIALFLGANATMMEDCLLYGRIMLLALPFFILEGLFQEFLVTAERPQLGLVFTVIAGVLNILLDYLLIVVCGMGLSGAGWATFIASAVGGVAPLTKLFVGYDPDLYALTCKAFRIYGLSYLLVGFNFYASSFFTALNNGKVSAVISTVRTLVFETSAVFILPALFGVDGIWFAILCAEVLALGLSFLMLRKYRNQYHYA